MKYGVDRQSSYELLRLLSMFFIVFYHLLRWFVLDNPTYDWVRALWIPLHVGVVVFILISGYFCIRPSSRGLLLLLGVLLVYSLPGIVSGIKNADSVYDVLHSLMFVSHSEFWFIKSYLALYLISPLLNSFFDNSSIRGKWYLLGVCALIAIYYGHFAKEVSFSEGKNLLNFMLIYQVGHILKEYSSKWKALNMNRLVISYLLLNFALVAMFIMSYGKWQGDVLWKLCFPYNSPILLLNATLLFVIFGKIEFHSSFINGLARNCFAIYLIHSITPLVLLFERPTLSQLFISMGLNVTAFIPLLLVVSILIMLVCSSINQLLSPLWKIIDRTGGLIQSRIGF